MVFERVKREKLDASREEGRELYFLCLKKRAAIEQRIF
jgi:23S rRNA U2552 (ribose-2'-O)-methylase RlmE/FtsJ